MRTYFFTVLVGIILTSTFVFLMDPGYRWRDAPKPFVRNLEPDEVRIFPSNFDERTMKVSHMKFIERPEILVLGSSRVALVSSDLFPKGSKVFNGGMSTSVVEDYIAIWQVAKELGKLPSTVIIFTDPWIFNSSANSQLTGWHFLQKYVDAFYRETRELLPNGSHASVSLSPPASTESTRPPIAPPQIKRRKQLNIFSEFEKIKTKLTHNLQLFSEIMSWPMVKESVRLFLRDGIYNDRTTKLIVKKSMILPEDRGILADGSILYPESEVLEKDFEVLRKKVIEEVTKPNLTFDDWRNDSGTNVKLTELLKDMRSHGARVLMISPPFHPLFVKNLKTKVGYADVFERAASELRSISESVHGVSFCNAENSAAVGCRETEMIDGVHMLKSCVAKVLRYCSEVTGWKYK